MQYDVYIHLLFIVLWTCSSWSYPHDLSQCQDEGLQSLAVLRLEPQKPVGRSVHILNSDTLRSV